MHSSSLTMESKTEATLAHANDDIDTLSLSTDSLTLSHANMACLGAVGDPLGIHVLVVLDHPTWFTFSRPRSYCSSCFNPGIAINYNAYPIQFLICNIL